MPRSAEAPTVVRTGPLELLPGVGSEVVLPPVAKLVTLVVLFGAVTMSVKLVLTPAARSPRFAQRTVLPLNTPPPLALTKVTPAGRLSVTDKLVASDGPRFRAVMV